VIGILMRHGFGGYTVVCFSKHPDDAPLMRAPGDQPGVLLSSVQGVG
jgi:hypothetical protein